MKKLSQWMVGMIFTSAAFAPLAAQNLVINGPQSTGPAPAQGSLFSSNPLTADEEAQQAYAMMSSLMTLSSNATSGQIADLQGRIDKIRTEIQDQLEPKLRNGDIQAQLQMQAASKIMEALQARLDLYKDSVSVGGNGVTNARKVQLATDMKLSDSIKAAGGFGPWADKTKVEIVNKNATTPTLVNADDIAVGKAKDPVLQAGDTITVHNKEFVFNGGNPEDFIKAIDRYYGTKWVDIANIPEAMYQEVKVPYFRLEPNGTGPLQVAEFYNVMGEKSPALGQWSVLYSTNNQVSSVMLVPDKNAPVYPAQSKPETKVIALPLAGIDPQKWQSLVTGIQQGAEIDHKTNMSNGGTSTMSGTCFIQEDSKILVITGTQSYIDMANSFKAAYEKSWPVRFDSPPAR